MARKVIDKQSKNIETLKEFGTDYMKENIFRPRIVVPEVHYNKNMLQIGRRMDGSIYTLDLSEACRCLILGATRSGKTFLLREIVDRLYQTERDVLIINDCKNEFVSSLNPVQEKFRGNLIEGEKPTGLPIVSLRPTFFKTISQTLPKNNYWYSVDMKELTKGDFLTMMNTDGLTPTQQIAMDLIYEEIKKKLEDGQRFSVPMVEEIIDSIDEISGMQKNSLKFKFRPLIEAKFIENDYERSMLALFRHPKRFIPTINMENFDSFGKGAFNFPEVVMNIALREAIFARRKKLIKPLFVIFDEAPRFLGNDKTGCIKQTVSECLEENTLIKTSNGDKSIKDLDEKNDKVLSFDGKNNIWSEFHKFGKKEKELYEVELEDGRTIICSENHKLFTFIQDGKLYEKEVKDLRVGNKIVTTKFCECGEELSRSSKQFCSRKCKFFIQNLKFNTSGKNNPMYGKKNPHTEIIKKQITNTLLNNYKNDVNGIIKGKISKSSKRTYEDRMGKEISTILKEKHKIKMTIQRNKDVRFDANIVKANLGKKLTEERKKSIGIQSKKFWDSLSEDDKASLVKKTIWLNRGKKTNLERDAEKILNKFGFEFYGDGKKGNVSGLFPDFVNFDKKLIVEVFALKWKEYTFGSRTNYEILRRKQFPDWNIYFFDENEIIKIEGVMNEIFKD